MIDEKELPYEDMNSDNESIGNLNIDEEQIQKENKAMTKLESKIKWNINKRLQINDKAEIIQYKGIKIHFPYHAYNCQKEYLHKLIDILTSGSIGILESPTGTGKTISLLCGCLAFLIKKRETLIQEYYLNLKKKEKVETPIKPIIYYTTRSYNQIKNIIEELQKTVYNPITGIYGSRDMLCLNQNINKSKGNVLNTLCHQLRSRKGCDYQYSAPFDKYIKKDIIESIEDTRLYCNEQKLCPLYYQRNKCILADLVIMPYNYIFNKKYKKKLKIDLSNSILIIDECHNIDNICNENFTKIINTSTLETLKKNLKDLIKKHNEEFEKYQELLRYRSMDELDLDIKIRMLLELDTNEIEYQIDIIEYIYQNLLEVKLDNSRRKASKEMKGIFLFPDELFEIFFMNNKSFLKSTEKKNNEPKNDKDINEIIIDNETEEQKTPLNQNLNQNNKNEEEESIINENNKSKKYILDEEESQTLETLIKKETSDEKKIRNSNFNEFLKYTLETSKKNKNINNLEKNLNKNEIKQKRLLFEDNPRYLDKFSIKSHIKKMKNYENVILKLDYSNTKITEYIEFMKILKLLMNDWNQYILDLELTENELANRNIKDINEYYNSILSRKSVPNKYNYMINNYKFYIGRMPDIIKDKFMNSYVKKECLHICLYCFNTSFAFKQLLKNNKLLSCIFTSGTLSPINTYVNDIDIDFKEIYCGQHIVKKEQYKIMVLKNSLINPAIKYLCFQKKLEKEKILTIDIGNTIIEIIKNIKGGILLFFSSYKAKDIITKIWSENNILKKIETLKIIYEDDKKTKKK